jgi:hypothetical protein
MKDSDSFEILPRNKFFLANRSIVEYEIRPGNTVSFISEVDLTEVERIREAARDRRPSYTAFVVKAVALALKEFPYANRRVCRRSWLPFSGARQQQFNRQDVAVACERDIEGAEGVAFVDVVRDADEKPLDEITTWLHELGHCDVSNNKQWREFSSIIGRLPNWLSKLLIRMPYFIPKMWTKYRGGSVLISSPAKYGVDGLIATWSWPLGVSFGLAKQRAVVRDDKVVACPTFFLSLNFDRRIMAGAQAARFFQFLVSTIEHPTEKLSLDSSMNPKPGKAVLLECSSELQNGI